MQVLSQLSYNPTIGPLIGAISGASPAGFSGCSASEFRVPDGRLTPVPARLHRWAARTAPASSRSCEYTGGFLGTSRIVADPQERPWTDAAATSRRSATNPAYAASRACWSGARRIEDGWTVAAIIGPKADGNRIPCWRVTRKVGLIDRK